MICPYCKEFESNAVVMATNDSDSRLGHFWECSECGCRVMPGQAGYTSAEKLWDDEQRTKRAMMKPGSGGGSSGRKRKAEKKKADVWTEC